MSLPIPSMEGHPELTSGELLELCAVDTGFYGLQFFPKACRQAPPMFHRELYAAVDDVSHRFVGVKIYRGGAKTTVTRVALSKRVAFAISRTIILVGKSEASATASLAWLKRNIMFNTPWADFFRLKRGKVWRDNHIEVLHEGEGVLISIMAVGMGGSIRGINLDDYRPDFIMVDDPCDEENTGTPEQREKTSELFFGALMNTLAPISDNPFAKAVLLQTPLAKGDLIDLATNDPQWYGLTYGCFTDDGESRWPTRQPTSELMLAKQGYANRNQMSLWLREMECKLTSRETVAFLPEWLIKSQTRPVAGFTLIAVDPTPPPKQNASGPPRARHDDAVAVAMRFSQGKVFILEGKDKKSPDPSEFCLSILEMAIAHRAQAIAVETILFARVLAHLLRRIMQEQRVFFRIIEVEDRRAKDTRIRDEVSRRASNQALILCEPVPSGLEEQFLSYPDVNHDDWLDALSIGLTAVSPHREQQYIEGEYSVIEDEDEDIRELSKIEEWKSCP